MPRTTGKDGPDNSGFKKPNSPYLRPGQEKLRASFNVRRSARLAEGGSNPAGKGASSVKHARSPTPFPHLGAHHPRPRAVPRTRPSRLRPIVPSPPPEPVPGSSSNPIDVDVEIIGASPAAPVASDPPMPKSKDSTRQQTRFRMPGGQIVDCNDLPSVETPRTTGLDAIMEDANGPPPPPLPSALDGTRGPVAGPSLAAPKNKGKGKILEFPRPFNLDSVSAAIASVGMSPEKPRERKVRLAYEKANEKAEQQLKRYLRHEQAREVRTQDKRRQVEDAQVAHDERCMVFETQIRRDRVGAILPLWKRFSDEVAARDGLMKMSKTDGVSSSTAEECSKMAQQLDSLIGSLLSIIQGSIHDARGLCTELQKAQPHTRNMCQDLRRGRYGDAAERITQLQAEQDQMLADLQSGLENVPTLHLKESERQIHLLQEGIAHTSRS
ncbi:hypothetical protein NLI96_g11656 [Meripilus lineatus]|uniref:Uncharacterized protein n=1 Tax=Meripilus lineatus TaxID=2056292 RepID=A0AAD5YD70_9APHY|nr:hypothetical protein NLI96_g11656 [Physisporinus lineatus]